FGALFALIAVALIGGARGPFRSAGGPTLVVLTEAELGRARRPSPPTLDVEDLLGDSDLLVLRGQVGPRGVLQATEAGPGVRVELETSVEAVAGVDAPVAAALALRERVPGLLGRRVGGRGEADGGNRGGYAGDGGSLGNLGRETTRLTDAAMLAFVGHDDPFL